MAAIRQKILKYPPKTGNKGRKTLLNQKKITGKTLLNQKNNEQKIYNRNIRKAGKPAPKVQRTRASSALALLTNSPERILQT